jgi:hypothetical protein
MAEASALLRPREHIVRALAKELLIRRSLTGSRLMRSLPPPSRRSLPMMSASAVADWEQRQSSTARFVR